jgi:Do/DeqQ family serine protease
MQRYQIKGARGVVMKDLWPCRLPKTVFLKLILIEMLCMAALWTPVQANERNTPGGLSTAIAQVARQNIPAVVHIEVIQRQDVVNPMVPFENDPFFQYFFGVPRMNRNFKRELRGLGTGMIIDSQGHILTNNHVVGGANEIKILLASGERYQAKLVGTDPKTDLAVIRVSTKKPLPHVTFGDSNKVEVGEWVVAIGHPRGLDQTVTQGIISAKHRRGIMNPSSYQDFLQTDAAINPGNSGGPLLNLQGEVIGINAAIVSRSGGFEGLGFAIPSNMARYIAKQLISHGKVERGWIGVNTQEFTPELTKSFGMDVPKGALVADVVSGSPADRAGIQRGDVVIEYQGKDIPNSSTLRNEVAATPIGQEAKVRVLRKGKKQELTVMIGKPEDTTRMLARSLKDRLGAEVRPVTAKEAEEYNLSPHQGVEIVWLDTRGPIAKVGFEVEDIILEINGQTIESMESFVNLVSSLRTHQLITLLALDHRTTQTGYVQVSIR